MTSVRPEPDRVRLERDYAPQLAYADRLLETVWRARPENHELNDRYAFNMAAILGRSMSTFRGVLTLLRTGLPEQAWMLNRSLFEDLVAALWLSIPEKREEALDKIEMQDARIALLEDDRREKHRDRLRTETPREQELEAMRPELDDAFGRWGEKTWFPNLYRAVGEIESYLEAEGRKSGELALYYDFFQTKANLYLHMTVIGLLNVTRGSTSRRGGRHFTYGQRAAVDEHEMAGVLSAACWCFLNIAELVTSEVSGEDESRFAELTAEHKSLHKLAPSKRAAIGRNEPCWCGSGKKLKHCHAA